MFDVLTIDGILQAYGRSGNPLHKLALLESVDSTNAWCLQRCREGLILPFACVTDNQTRGKGRRGHRWHSAPGASITLSLAWGLDLPSNRLGMLSLAIGMAVANVLRAQAIAHVMLKWPNDVLVNHQKIAGVLIETIMVNGKLNIVIGVGLNYDIKASLSSQTDMADIDYAWTDIRQQVSAARVIARDQLIGMLLRECVTMCERYQRDYYRLSAEFDCRYNAFIELPVNVVLGNGEVITGISKGTTEQGELRVLVGEQERVFNSAEISLRRDVTC